MSFAVSAHDLNQVIKHGEHVVEMVLDGQPGNYLIKAVQYDAYGDELVHADFVRVRLDETVQVTVPVILRGAPAGAVEGGVLVPGLLELRVECLVTNIPEDVRVRVNDLKIGDVLHVKDLPPMEGVEILNDPEAILASCTMVTEEEVAAPVVAVEGEETTQPEVIGKGKKEEEGEAEGEEAKEAKAKEPKAKEPKAKE